MLGPLAVAVGGAEIALSAPKLRRLLAALVLGAGTRRSADSLIDTLWDETPPASADKLVQVYVSQLRKLLPDGMTITTDAGGYAIRPDGWQLDARRFEELLGEARAERAGNPQLAASLLHRALGLWRGVPAYAEIATVDLGRFESERLDELRRQALEERIELELRSGRHAEVLPEARAAADADPLRERLQGHLMSALYRSGQQAAALEHYRSVRTRLVAELGVEPGDELRRLHQQMLRQELMIEAAQPAAVSTRTVDLPSSPNALRGRNRELAELAGLLRSPNVRLLVLTGAGGSGKTRLAIEAGRQAAPEFANGARFVSLAAIRDPEALPAAIAAALDVPSSAGRPLDALLAELANREVLLILDNVEHLRAAAPQLVTLLAGAPRLTLLVTSRVVLHVSGEHVYPVDPLSDAAAAAVFVERAVTSNARLARDELDGGTVELMCRRLDRLPLAIELAASHLRALTPAELLAQLDTRLPMLVGGPADLPSRQRTLRATLAWSFDQLEPQAQRDLAALSVFVDGFSLAAAAAVLRSGEETPNRLLGLIDHSLLTHAATTHGSRYAMLETVREFAAERLVDGDEQQRVRRGHAEYMLEFAQALGLSVDALVAGRPKRNDLAVAEQANLRAALDWSQDAEPLLGLELMAALEQFWIAANPPEAAGRLQLLLDRAVDAPPGVRARALRDLGGAVEFTGDQARAVRCYEASLELYRRLGDEAGELQLVHRMVQQAIYAGDHARARTLVDDALRRATAGGHRFAECQLRLTAGWLAIDKDDYDAAFREVQTALRIMREIGEWPWGETGAVRTLAEICSATGRHVEALAYTREALLLIASTGDRIKTVTVLSSLAVVHLRAGDVDTAGMVWGVVEAEQQRSFLGFWVQRSERYAVELNSCTDEVFQRARVAGHGRAFADLIAELLVPRT